MDTPGDVYDRVNRDYDEYQSHVHQAEANCVGSIRHLKEYVEKLSDEPDLVNSPPHYTIGNIECIDYIKDIFTEEEYRGYLRGNITKYHHRLMHKGSAKQNAEKMRWYLDKLIEVL